MPEPAVPAEVGEGAGNREPELGVGALSPQQAEGADGAGFAYVQCRARVADILDRRGRALLQGKPGRRGREVFITFNLDASGALQDVRVHKGSGQKMFDDAALELVRQPLATDCAGSYSWGLAHVAPLAGISRP